MSFDVQVGLEFRAADHVYRLRGEDAVSVSEIVRASGMGSPLDLPEHLATGVLDRGSRFHKSIEEYMVGGLIEVDADNEPHFACAVAYAKHRDLIPLVMEFPMAARTADGYVIAGTVDLIARTRVSNLTVIVDWKRGAVTPGNLVQMAGYLWLARENGYEIHDGIVVDCSGLEPVAYSPTSTAALTWQMMTRTHGSNDRAIDVFGVAHNKTGGFHGYTNERRRSRANR